MTPEDVQRLKEMEKRMSVENPNDFYDGGVDRWLRETAYLEEEKKMSEDLMQENLEYMEAQREKREDVELALEWEYPEEERERDEEAYLTAEQLWEAQRNRDKIVDWLKANNYWENSKIPDSFAAHFEQNGVSFAKLFYRLLDSLS